VLRRCLRLSANPFCKSSPAEGKHASSTRGTSFLTARVNVRGPFYTGATTRPRARARISNVGRVDFDTCIVIKLYPSVVGLPVPRSRARARWRDSPLRIVRAIIVRSAIRESSDSGLGASERPRQCVVVLVPVPCGRDPACHSISARLSFITWVFNSLPQSAECVRVRQRVCTRVCTVCALRVCAQDGEQNRVEGAMTMTMMLYS